ncbi:MAG: glycosyltransferase [Desulfobacterales bacterium]|nr:glycosyltransferase [Desulfobacterales bacterium]
MKIIYVVHRFLPDSSAGTEILTYSTAKEFLRRGHDVIVFAGYPLKKGEYAQNNFDQYFYDGLHIERFYHSYTQPIFPKNPVVSEYNNIFFAERFQKRLDELSPDIVHFYHLQFHSASVIDVCVKKQVPMVYTATDFWFICPFHQLLLPDYRLCNGPDSNASNCLRCMTEYYNKKLISYILKKIPNIVLSFLLKLIKMSKENNRHPLALFKALAARPAYLKKRINFFKKVVVPTRHMAQKLIEFGLDQRLVMVKPYGIQKSHYENISVKGQHQRLKLGFIGTFHPCKGAHILLKAFQMIPSKLAVDLYMYGDTKACPEYSEKLTLLKNNDPRIHFCGTFANEKIGEILLNIDILVVPSIWYENAPVVISEAQAAKLPVITSNLGGLNTLVFEGVNGKLFEAGNVEQLAGIIQELYNNRPLIHYLSENSKPPPSIESYADMLESIYYEAIS